MDTSTKQDSTDVMLADKAKEIIRLMMTHLPTEGDSEEVSYSYLDAETERNFEIRRFESYKDDGTPYKRFFMSEFVPNGRLCKLNSKGHVVDAWDEPLIKQLEEKFGPNSLMTRLRAADIDPDRMVKMGGGLGVGSRFHPSLEVCASEIAQALHTNLRYEYFQPLSEQERIKLEFQQARMTHVYWKQEQRRQMQAEALGEGIFKGCSNMRGATLPKDIKDAILAYLNQPSQEGWLEIRGYIVTGMGTLWQAWCAHDPLAPRGGNQGFPDSNTLVTAIRAAVERRAVEIQERLDNSSPRGLRLA
jgi:hypothetical protein